MGALIGVHGFQIRGVAHHVIFDLDAVAAVHVAGDAGNVERLAAFLRLTFEIISGAILPSSIRRPTRNEACKPSAMSVCMSASFFCTSCVAASGRSNCLRSSVYWRARCMQSSAAPIAPQEMP